VDIVSILQWTPPKNASFIYETDMAQLQYFCALHHQVLPLRQRYSASSRDFEPGEAYYLTVIEVPREKQAPSLDLRA